MRLLDEIKERWRKYLEEMAKANEKMWKGRKPSCCAKEDNAKEDKEGVKK